MSFGTNKQSLIFVVISIFILLTACDTNPQKKKELKIESMPEVLGKIVWIDSYHPEYVWSDGILKGIQSKLKGRKVELIIHHMDTKVNQGEDFKKNAALKAKAFIDSIKPDLIIASDDNAQNYLIKPYFLNGNIPVVFNGVNSNPKDYGYPGTNATGMQEVQLIPEIIKTLAPYAKSKHVSFISRNTLTDKKNAALIDSIFNLKLNYVFIESFHEWKDSLNSLQKDSGIVIIANIEGAKGWDEQDAVKFIEDKIKTPTGCFDHWLMNYCLLGVTRSAEEQGEWAAEQAIKILKGTPATNIPITQNKKAELFLNMRIAKNLGISFSPDIIEFSHIISEDPRRILYINSYHKTYEWSDDLEKGFLRTMEAIPFSDSTFHSSTHNAEIRRLYMNSKLNPQREYIEERAKQIKKVADAYQPDLIIATDDNASKFVIKPYFYNSEIPVVFAGVNWSAEDYGFPTTNITGLIETAPIEETIELIKQHIGGNTVSYIGDDVLSTHKIISETFVKRNIPIKKGILVKDFKSWKDSLLTLQEESDIILLVGTAGLQDFNKEEALQFVKKNIRKPLGASWGYMSNYSMLGIRNIPLEHGMEAADIGIMILNGTSPTQIPIRKNVGYAKFVNLGLIENLDSPIPKKLLDDPNVIKIK